MRYAEWIRRTTGGMLSPRSARLKQVDQALRQYERAPNELTLRGMEVAFAAWQGSKDNWEQSIRNKDGAATDFARWLLELRIPTAPPPPMHPLAPPRRALPTGDVAAQAAAKARSRRQLEEAQEYKVAVNGEQTITYPPGSARNVWVAGAWQLQTVTVPTPQSFPLNIHLGFILRGTELEVRVRAKLVGKAGVTVTQRIKDDFSTHIQSAWNIATVIDGGTAYDLRFNLLWVESGAGYEINVANPPPIALGLSRDEVAQLNRQNTINVAEWAWSDRQAIIHEFGHMIGCPDEYTVSSFKNLGQPYDASIYNKPAFSTDSIMNNTTQRGRIKERHFYFILHQYKLWQQFLGTEPNATVRIRDVHSQNVDLARAVLGRRAAMGYDD